MQRAASEAGENGVRGRPRFQGLVQKTYVLAMPLIMYEVFNLTQERGIACVIWDRAVWAEVGGAGRGGAGRDTTSNIT